MKNRVQEKSEFTPRNSCFDLQSNAFRLCYNKTFGVYAAHEISMKYVRNIIFLKVKRRDGLGVEM